ncbi:MAG: NAD-dependent epimerase/dehydratase family protein [Nitrospirae bacterium]|nr:NAD-dependent epimerase/dehydratase family protein [Nitrospirota bacterium]
MDPLPVRVLVHRAQPPWLSAMRHVRSVTGDILDSDSLEPLLNGCDVVINLSGQVCGDVEQYLSVNLQGTIRLSQSCLRHGVTRVVHASSALVYGDALAATEDSPCRPITPYATMKLAAEEILCGTLGEEVSLTCLRLSNVYGPYQNKGLVPYLIDCIRNRRGVTIDADGAQVRDFVYVRDVADALIKTMETSGCHGIFNIGSGQPTSVMSLLRLLEDVLEQSATGRYCPEHTGGERRNTVNVEKARETLGWRGTMELTQGVRTMLGRDARVGGGVFA